mmetsp:Transcript_954/g.2907  ORF Transcript_954/g.2907 Transcript_954/m.2907 type:complete len:408 (+) Transcript_954:94-1317(+)
MNILHALTLAALAVSASACESCDGCFKAKKNKCTPATDIDKETCLNKNGRGQSVWCPDANEFASYELQTSSGKGFRARGFKPLTATRDSPAPVVVVFGPSLFTFEDQFVQYKLALASLASTFGVTAALVEYETSTIYPDASPFPPPLGRDNICPLPDPTDPSSIPDVLACISNPATIQSVCDDWAGRAKDATKTIKKLCGVEGADCEKIALYGASGGAGIAAKVIETGKLPVAGFLSAIFGPQFFPSFGPAKPLYLGDILPSVNPHPCFLDVLSPTPTGLPNYLQKLDKSKVRSVISARDDYFGNPLPGNDAAAIAPVAALQQIWTQQACADLDCIQSEGEGYFVVPTGTFGEEPYTIPSIRCCDPHSNFFNPIDGFFPGGTGTVGGTAEWQSLKAFTWLIDTAFAE